tara:strand:- start:1003 stop:2460 length:1458 start_codon:yes stop_codon:yes gene_type:complete
MNFLGLRLEDHDANICYTENGKAKYIKTERIYQQKHHGYSNFNGWLNVLKDWGVELKDIDAIGIVTDDGGDDLWEVLDFPLFKHMGFKKPVFRIDHHYAHALSIWPLGIKTDVDIVFDGFGNNDATHTVIRNNEIISRGTIYDHPSLGQIMGNLGDILEIRGINLDHAGKLMALKGHGNVSQSELESLKKNLSRYDIQFLDHLWDIDCVKGLKWQEICNHIQVCHTFTEQIYNDFFCKYSEPGEVVGYSGGIAQNTVINSAIDRNLVIPPHCADDGLSFGAVEFLRRFYQEPEFCIDGYPFWQEDDCPEEPTEQTIELTAKLLSEGKIVGWYQGKGEVGARALGNRSILMDPRIKDGKDILNTKVKHREEYRPFGASVLEEAASDYFDIEGKSPYMLYVHHILDPYLPSITHVDETCRIQTVSKEQKHYYSLLTKFESLSGLPVLLNTSLNNGGKPICGSRYDAIELLHETDLDVLVIGNDFYLK